MSLPPQKLREAILQVLYSQSITGANLPEIVDLLMSELKITKKNAYEACKEAEKILAKSPQIKELVSSFSTSYDFERIHLITQSILILAGYEILFVEELSPKIVIAEAIRLSKKFNTPESAAFVNAVLDQIYKQKQGVQVDTLTLESEVQKFEESEKKRLDSLLQE